MERYAFLGCGWKQRNCSEMELRQYRYELSIYQKDDEVVVVTDEVFLALCPAPLKHKHPFSAVKMQSGDPSDNADII